MAALFSSWSLEPFIVSCNLRHELRLLQCSLGGYTTYVERQGFADELFVFVTRSLAVSSRREVVGEA